MRYALGGFFMRLDDDHTRQVKALKSEVLKQLATGGQGIACLVGQALVVTAANDPGCG